MSGIVIDVDTRSNKARVDLKQLNDSLAQIVKNTQITKQALGGLNSNDFKSLDTQLRTTSRNFNILGTAAKATLTGMLMPFRAVGSLATNLKFQIFALAGALGSIKGIGAFNELGDNLLQIQSKLKMVSKGTENLTTTQYELYRVASVTRTTLNDSVDVYFNLRKAMSSSSMATEEFVKVTETIQKTVSMSKMPIQTIRGAMIQLNQGLASGTLRGEELNSVLEGIPDLGMRITKALDTNTGALRRFAEEGKLTTPLLLDIFKKMAKDVDNDFTKFTYTAQEGFTRLTESIKLFFGELNMYLGSSQRFGRFAVKLAESVDDLTTTFSARLFNLKSAVVSVREEFDLWGKLNFATRLIHAFDISPTDFWSIYKKYNMLMDLREGFADWVEKQKSTIDKTFGTNFSKNASYIDTVIKYINKAKKAFEEFSGYSMPSFGEKENGFKKLKDSIAKNVVDIVMLVRNFAYAFTGIFDKFDKLVPDVRIPMRTFSNDMDKMLRDMIVSVYAWSIQVTVPVNRAMDAVYENMHMYLKGDTELERAWVNLFRADSIAEFSDRLEELGDAERNIRFNNLSVVIRDVSTWFGGLVETIKEPLRYMEILDNRLLFVNNVRFDRLISGAQTFASIMKRIYTDVLFPKFAPIVYRWYLEVAGAFEALAGAIEDNIDFNVGEAIGRNLVKGIKTGFSGIIEFMQNLFNGKYDVTFDWSTPTKKIAEAVRTILVSTVTTVFGFLKGIFAALFESTPRSFRKSFEAEFSYLKTKFKEIFSVKSVTDKLFGGMIESIISREVRYKFTIDPSNMQELIHLFDKMALQILIKARELSSKAEQHIKRFSDKVKFYFWDMYDKVVGHSYWPDMIDGIVDYTSRLFPAESRIEKFIKNIDSNFKSLKEKVVKFKDKAFEIAGEISLSLSKIDFGTLGLNLKEVLGASVLAALMFVFGNNYMKIIASDFFLSVITDGLYDTFSGASVGVAEMIGQSAAVLAKQLSSSIMHGLNLAIEALPEFTQGFLGGLGGIGSALAKLLSLVPDNGLFYAMLWGTAGYAAFTKKGMDNIKSFLLGDFGKDSKGKKTDKRTGDGALSYATAIFGNPMDKIKEKVTGGNGKPGWLDLLVFGPTGNPKLLLASIGVFSLAFLDSISFIEAATFGVPMLAMAILGKDAGGKAVRDMIFGVLPRLASDVFAATAMYFSKFSATRPLANFMANIMDNMSFLAEKGEAKMNGRKGRFRPRSNFQMLGDGIKQAFINSKANAAEYAAGKISFSEMFLNTKDAMGGTHKLALANRFKKVWEEVINKSVMGISLASVGTKIKSAFETMLTGIGDFFAAGGGMDKIKTNLTLLLTGIGSAFNGLWDLIKTGLSGLATFFKSKLGIFLLLMTAFSGIANAANETPFADRSFIEKISYFVKNILIATAAIAGLGIVLKGLAAFRMGKMAAIDAVGAAAMASAEAIAASQKVYRETLLKTGTHKAGAAGIAGAAAQATLSSYGEKAKGDFVASGAANLAGVEAVKKSFADTFSWLIKIKDAVKNSIFNKDWWADLDLRVQNWFDKFDEAIYNYIKNSPRLSAFAIGIFESFEIGGIAGIKRFGTALKDLTKGAFTFSGVMSMLTGAVSLFGKACMLALRSLWALLAPILGVSAIVAGVAAIGGAIGVALFGTGDSLAEKFEWAKDRVLEIFNIKPTGRSARLTDLVDAIPKATIKDQEGSNYRVDYKKRFEGLDYEKLTQSQYDTLLETAQNTKTIVDEAKKESIKYGHTSDETMKKLKDAEKEMDRMLSRFPKMASKTLTGAIEDSTKRLLANPPTMWMKIKMGFGNLWYNDGLSLSEAFSGELKKRADETDVEFAKRRVTYDKTDFTIGRPTQDQMYNYDPGRITKYIKGDPQNSIKKIHEQIIQFQSGLDDKQIEIYKDALEKMTSAFERMQQLDWSVNTRGNERFRDRLNKATADYNESKRQFLAIGKGLLIEAVPIAEAKVFEEALTKMTKGAKELADIDFGKNNKEFYGSSLDIATMEQMMSMIRAFDEEAVKYGRSTERGQRALLSSLDLTAKLKAKGEEVKNSLQFKARLEYAVKLSGVEVATNDLANLFAVDPMRGVEFLKITKEIEALQFRLDNFKNIDVMRKPGESLNDYSKRMSELQPKLEQFSALFIGKSKLMEQASKLVVLSPFDKLNTDLAKNGLAQLSKEQFLFLDKKKVEEFAASMSALQEQKDKLAKIDPNTQFDNWLSVFKLIVDQSDVLKKNLEAATQAPTKLLSQQLGGNASQEKLELLRAKNPKAYSKWESKGKALQDARDLLAKPDTDPAATPALKAQAAKLLEGHRRAMEDAFKDAGKTIFDRFGEYVQKGGLSISLEDMFTVGPDAYKSIKSMIDKSVKMKKALDNSGNILPKDEAAARKQFEEWLKLKDDINKKIEEAKSKTFGNIFEKITKGGFSGEYKDIVDIDPSVMKKFFDIGSTITSLEKQLEDVFALKNSNPEEALKKFRELMQKFADEANKKKGLLDRTLNFGDKFKFVSEHVKDVDFNTWINASQTTRDNLFNASIKLRDVTEILNKATSPSQKIKDDFIAAQKAARKAGEELAKSGTNRTTFAATAAQAAGIQIEPLVYTNLDSETKKLFDSLTEKIIEEQRKLETPLSEAEDKVTRNRIASMQQAANILVERQAEIVQKALMSYKDTQAYKAGESFASTVTSDFGNGLKELITGKSKFQDVAKGFMDSFTSTVINTFIDGMMSAMNGKDGLINKFLKGIGIDIFQAGAAIFGGNGEPKIASEVIFQTSVTEFAAAVAMFTGSTTTSAAAGATDKLGGLLKGFRKDSTGANIPPAGNNPDEAAAELGFFDKMKSTLSSGWEGLKGTLSDAWSSFSGVLSNAWSGLTSMFSGFGDSLSGIFNSLGSSLSGLFSSLGSGMSSAGSGIMSWIGTLFAAEGGYIKGAGTGTSDSIAAMLSNGEYVVRASQTKKFLPLLDAINNNQLPRFAVGGVVGDIPDPVGFKAGISTVENTSMQTTQTFNIHVTGDISRQTRAEIQKMLPQIATGVNVHNREQGRRR